MPPKTKGRKTLKESNDNVNTIENKVKANYETRKTRKALVDKTNSDDRTKKQKGNKDAPELESKGEVNNNERPRRGRRLPPRFIDNHVLKNLSNGPLSPEINVKNHQKTPLVSSTIKTVKNTNINTKSAGSIKKPIKVVKVKTPIKKIPQNTSEINQGLNLKTRPKRVCRLPSKFEDHSVSPSKFIPIQPCFASTPIVIKSTSKKIKETVKKSNKNAKQIPVNEDISPIKSSKPTKITSETTTSPKQTSQATINTIVIKSTSKKIKETVKKSSKNTKQMPVNEDISPIKSSKLTKSTSETTTSPKQTSQATVNTVQNNKVTANRIRKAKNVRTLSPTKKAQKCRDSKVPIHNISKSYRLLDDNMNDYKVNADVYEFTYDPNEEPPPQKKKRKRPPTTKRKQIKPKIVVFKNNYNVNVAKSLQDLKDIVAKKTQHGLNELTKNNPETGANGNSKSTSEKNVQQIAIDKKSVINTENNLVKPSSSGMTSEMKRHNNDILEIDHHDNLVNYSPVNSPYRATSPILNSYCNTSIKINKPLQSQNRDPLNLQEDYSFFDDLPIASSSINMSVRHPHASPWRVDFQNLPLKWHPNTYVKPNMTPAIENSFINNFDEPKKKHVYTNMVPISNVPLPELHQEEPSNLVQSSIISFIKEVAEKAENKKKKERSATPNIFDLIASQPVCKQKTPKKLITPIKGTNCEPITPKKSASVEFDSNSSADISNEKENLKENRKRKSENEENTSTSKTPRKEKDVNNTLFGFDDSENQENISPVKKVDKRVRALRPRARAVLQEINNLKGPTRAVLPAKAKFAPSSETVNNLFEELKSAADAPVFQDKELVNINSNINQDSEGENSNSVHLFEDIDVVHHLKPTRKSYGKPKKVAFQQNSTSDDEASYSEQEQSSSSNEDLADLTFQLPSGKSNKTNKKKQSKKKKISKKEEAEAEAWAANFNSMCEDVEKVPLVVE